jgi:hypothetical protein
MALKLITPEPVPVGVAAFKQYARVDFDDEDSTIATLIAAARGRRAVPKVDLTMRTLADALRVRSDGEVEID